MEPYFGEGPMGPKVGGLSGYVGIPISPEICEQDTREL